MFAPGFGMFIAPGCDGIRGAVTMGYLALILGYLYRFSMRARFLSVMGAIALGYLFNLIRLCFLVLFYRVALSRSWLQSHGEGADYLIGGLLFLTAAGLFSGVVRWKRQNGGQPASSQMRTTDPARESSLKNHQLYWKGAVASLLIAMSSFSSARDLADMARGKMRGDGSELVSQNILPQQMGKYRMQRTWSDQDWLGHLAYRWAAYLDDSSGDEIDIALWLGPGAHYPIACHISRGQRPSSQQVGTLPTAQGGSATFAISYYEESDARTLEATTVCEVGGCSERVLLPSRTGFAFASMGVKNLFFRPTSRPLPILIRTQSRDLSVPFEDTKTKMVHETEDFISELNTYALIRFADSRNR
jgi:exosortase J